MKKLYLSAILILCLFLCCSCGSKAPSELVGEWNCLDEMEGCESGYGYYHLSISDDGSFSLYDQEAGNPGISGTLYGPDEVEGEISIKCGSEDFDPPFCWDISKNVKLDFVALTGNMIKLGYEDKWLCFENENPPEESFESFRLADRSEGYEWVDSMSGEGRVLLSVEEVKDEDVDTWQYYTVTADKAGDMTLLMEYTDGDETIYTVTFDLTVLDDGTVIEKSCDGDIDEAMTS